MIMFNLPWYVPGFMFIAITASIVTIKTCIYPEAVTEFAERTLSESTGAHVGERTTATKSRIRDNEISQNTSFMSKLDLSEESDCNITCLESVQRYRQQILNNACVKHHGDVKPSLWNANGEIGKGQMTRLRNLFPIEHLGVIYCSVPKDEATAWKRILLAVLGHIDDLNKYPGKINPLFDKLVKPLSRYNESEATRMLLNYKKFIFVRDPLQRMLSLFSDKTLASHAFRLKEDTFEVFLDDILQREVQLKSNGVDAHWTHAAYLCYPCDIKYDFIGRLETSSRDSQYVFDHFFTNFTKNLNMPRQRHGTNSTSEDNRLKYIGNTNVTILNELVKKYELDFDLFGYDKPSF